MNCFNLPVTTNVMQCTILYVQPCCKYYSWTCIEPLGLTLHNTKKSNWPVSVMLVSFSYLNIFRVHQVIVRSSRCHFVKMTWSGPHFIKSWYDSNSCWNVNYYAWQRWKFYFLIGTSNESGHSSKSFYHINFLWNGAQIQTKSGISVRPFMFS